jgi:hypothetical protein
MDQENNPIIHRYPPGKPEDLIILYFEFPRITNSLGKQVKDKRSKTLLEVIREPIGHLLSKRRVALYLELFYSDINITFEIVERCYNVFKLICQKSNITEDDEDDGSTLDFSFDSQYYKNLSTFNESRSIVIKDLFRTYNPTFPFYDVSFAINKGLKKNDEGKYILCRGSLKSILRSKRVYSYFMYIWTSFPDIQSIYDILYLIGFPTDVCLMILKFSTFGEKDCSGLPEADPFAVHIFDSHLDRYVDENMN